MPYPPIIWGPNSTAKIIAANGLVLADGSLAITPPNTGYNVVEHFISGVTVPNASTGQLGWRNGVNSSGQISGISGSLAIPAASAKYPGQIALGTGTVSNSTGQALIDLQLFPTYNGCNTQTVMTWRAQMPASLSNATVEYVIEMGFGVYPYESSTNGVIIQYKRTTSTNFSAYTANASTQTSVTTADTTFQVSAGTWYDFKIVLVSGLASFYVAPAFGSYSLLGTSSTNLPDSTHQCNPVFTIYKASTTTTQSSFNIDRVELDITY